MRYLCPLCSQELASPIPIGKATRCMGCFSLIIPEVDSGMCNFDGLKDVLKDGGEWDNTDPHPGNLGLVFVHGFGADPSEYEGLIQHLITRVKPKSVLVFSWGTKPRSLTWGHRHWLWQKIFRRSLTTEHPNDIVSDLKKQVEDLGQNYDENELLLVGHSMGAVFIQAAILEMADEDLKKVRGLMMLAPTNRGYLADDLVKRAQLFLAGRIPWILSIVLAVGVSAIGSFFVGLDVLPVSLLLLLVSFLALFVGKQFDHFTVFHLLRGADWITGIRLKWIELMQKNKTPRAVLIRGAGDSLIGEYDNVEAKKDPRAQLEEPLRGVNHHHLKLTPANDKHAAGLEKVKERIEQAIDDGLQWIDGEDTNTNTAGDQQLVDAEKVHTTDDQPRVFLIHGIRDLADWHEPLGYKIEECFGNTPVKIVSITYGYFSAFQFLLPGERTRCSLVFRDRYVFERAQAPEADFFAIAHSNGTFVLDTVINTTAEIRLTSIVLAGSVLNRDVDWPKYYAAKRIGYRPKLDEYIDKPPVVNFRAAGDVPVGMLCRGLAGLSRQIYLLVALGIIVLAVFSLLLPATSPLAFTSIAQSMRNVPAGMWVYVASIFVALMNLFFWGGLPYRKLGTAGVDGFLRRKLGDEDVPEIVMEPNVLDGGHSAALTAAYHEKMGNYFNNNGSPEHRLSEGDGRWPKPQGITSIVLCRSGFVAGLVVLLLAALLCVMYGLLMLAASTVAWGVVLGAALTFIIVRLMHNA